MAKKNKKQQQRKTQQRAQKRQQKAKKREEVHRVAKAQARDEALRRAREGGEWREDPFADEVLAASIEAWTTEGSGYGALGERLECARWEAVVTYEAWLDMGHTVSDGVVTRISVEEASDEALSELLAEAGIGADDEAREALVTGKATAWEVIEAVWRPAQADPIDERMADALWLTLLEWWRRVRPDAMPIEAVHFDLEEVGYALAADELVGAMEIFVGAGRGLLGTMASFEDTEPIRGELIGELEVTLAELARATVEAEQADGPIDELVEVVGGLAEAFRPSGSFGMTEGYVILLDGLGRHEQADATVAAFREAWPEDVRSLGHWLDRRGAWTSTDPELIRTELAGLRALLPRLQEEGVREIVESWIVEIEEAEQGWPVDEPAAD